MDARKKEKKQGPHYPRRVWCREAVAPARRSRHMILGHLLRLERPRTGGSGEGGSTSSSARSRRHALRGSADVFLFFFSVAGFSDEDKNKPQKPPKKRGSQRAEGKNKHK